jgi:hypothetical protein
MPYVGFEPTIPGAKTVHALDRSATVTGVVYVGLRFNCIPNFTYRLPY